MRSAKAFLAEHRFQLPPVCGLDARRMAEPKGRRSGRSSRTQLGWDITDFGSGDFLKCGLFLFTIRNGSAANLKTMSGKTYAEKIMIVEVGQVTPMHFHWQKTEDIINRGGGTLVIQLFNSTPEEALADTEVTVSTDGVQRTAQGGRLKCG